MARASTVYSVPTQRPPWRWAIAGALLGLVGATVVYAPARWLTAAIQQASGQQIQFTSARGSVWQGSAQLVLSGGQGSADSVALPGPLGFGLSLHWLPVGGWEHGALSHQVLPVLTLALPQIAIVARLTEASMRDALVAPHIRTLRAFGLPGWHINAHALRGALLPVLSYLGPAAAALLTGSIVVETIFGIPGIGRYFVDGALSRDYTLVMATVVIVGVMVVVFNLIVDIAYGVVDPRVRYD